MFQRRGADSRRQSGDVHDDDEEAEPEVAAADRGGADGLPVVTVAVFTATGLGSAKLTLMLVLPLLPLPLLLLLLPLLLLLLTIVMIQYYKPSSPLENRVVDYRVAECSLLFVYSKSTLKPMLFAIRVFQKYFEANALCYSCIPRVF